MQDPKITHFPVGNGDCTLITLSDNAQILIDCNITEDSRDEEEESRYDVHTHLLKVAKRRADAPYVDTFILSHADQDHCRGFDTTFYCGDPTKYSRTHASAGILLIDELWFTPRVFCPYENDLCPPAEAFRKEALRRMELHKNQSPNRNLPGNRLRIIGYTDNPDRKGLEHLTTVPGSYVNEINGTAKTDFSFFVHAPFKLETDAKWSERNDTSLVLQARFGAGASCDDALVLLGGDAGAAIWEKIRDRSNDESTLEWDLFLAPHHCSWTFFSEKPYKENKIPAPASLDILRNARVGAQVVASCKPIRNDDDNPPHWAAAKLYKEHEDVDSFHVTSETPSKDRPLPIEFSVAVTGLVLEEGAASSAIASSAAKTAAVSVPQTYGRG